MHVYICWQGSVLRIGPALTICCCLRSSMPASYPHILVFSSLIWDHLGINGFWLLMSLLAINNCWFRELHPNIQGPWLHSVLLSSVQGLWPQCISQFILCSSESPSTTETEIGEIWALWFAHLNTDHNSGLINQLATCLYIFWMSPLNLKSSKNSWVDPASFHSVVMSENTS